MKKKKWLLQTKKQIDRGSILSAIGFGGYLAMSALKLNVVAGVIAVVFFMIAAWTFLSVVELREKDKEAVSLNTLWGAGSMALLLGSCVAVMVKQWLGL